MGSFVENVNKLAALTPAESVDLGVVVDNIDNINLLKPVITDLQSIVNNVVPNIAEILLADDNAATATTKAGEASTSASKALGYRNEAFGFRNEAEAFNESKAFVVDTVEDLLTIPSSYVTAVVRDLNRGGTFIWSATGTANGGTVFAGATGYWVRQYSGAVNVKWFENLSSFAVYMRNVSQDTNFTFNNGEYTRTDDGNFLNLPDLDNCSIENLTINNNKSVNGFAGHGISTSGDNLTYKNIKVLDYGSDGVGGGTGLLLVGENKNARVIDCHFEAEKDTSLINIGWLAADYTTSFFDRIYAKDIINGIGYAHELKNNSTHNILSNLISENSNILVAYGQQTEGIDGADFNIAANVVGKSTNSGYLVGEGHHNLLNGMLLDNTNNPIAPGVNSGFGVSYAGGASNNVSTGVLTNGRLTNEVSYSGSNNYTEIAAYSVSDHLVSLTPGSSKNVTNIIHAGARTSILDILDNSGKGLGVGGNVVYSNGYGQYIGSLSGSWLWKIADVNPAFLSSNHWRFTDEKYTYLALGSDGSTGNASGINFATPTTGNRGAFSFTLGATELEDYYGMRINGFYKYSFTNSVFRVGGDNDTKLGDSGHRWSTIFAATGTINTSDAREKTFSSIPEVENRVAVELKGLMKRFKFNDAIEAKGTDNARIHYGTSAQDVISVFEKYGLNAMDYAMVCYDEWEEQQEVKDEEGTITQEYRPAGNRYGIRYEELLCFIISAM